MRWRTGLCVLGAVLPCASVWTAGSIAEDTPVELASDDPVSAGRAAGVTDVTDAGPAYSASVAVETATDTGDVAPAATRAMVARSVTSSAAPKTVMTNLGEAPPHVFTGHVLSGTRGGILYAPSESDDAAYRAAISAAAGGVTVDYFDAITATPDLALLSNYDCVYVWTDYPFADKDAYGDVLADFVDAGGKVVLGVFCTYTSGSSLGGRIMTDTYCPVVSPSGDNHFSSSDYAGDGVTCIHAAVTGYECYYRDVLQLQGLGLQDGSYLDGEIAHAYRPDFAVIYSNGAGASALGCTGDWAQLVGNSCLCTGEPLLGACCTDAGCTIALEADCTGFWAGPWTECGADDDCDTDGWTDWCEIASGMEGDCNGNGQPDDCDVDQGFSPDCNGNIIPDECEVPPICPDCADCNTNGIPDDCEEDCNENAIPDDCDMADCTGEPWCDDCQPDGILDACQLDDTGLREGEVLISQLPNGLSGMFADLDCALCPTGVQVVAEQFVLAEEAAIGSIRMWIAFYPGDLSSDPDDMTVIFHADSAGLPGGAVYTEFAVPTTRSETGIILFGVHEWDATLELPEPLALSAGTWWVEVYANTAGNPDVMFWETGDLDPVAGIAGQAWAQEGPGVSWMFDASTDLAFELITGYAVPPPNDCNDNGVPDECDIASGFSTDWNGNDIPDECEPLCGDLDGDGDVDADDYWAFLDAFGTCVGDPNYNPDADFDGDGCITLPDYQNWLLCYRMATGGRRGLPVGGWPGGAPGHIDRPPTRPAGDALPGSSTSGSTG